MLCFTDFDYEKIKTRDYIEYNKIQNLFLKYKNIDKILASIYRFDETAKFIETYCEFEGMFNWDIIISDTSWYYCTCDKESSIYDKCTCGLSKRYIEECKIPEDKYTITYDDEYVMKCGNVYCNIQPLLGDNYTNILRKMKTQIELKNNYLANEKDMDIHKNEGESYDNNNYVLVIKEFISTTTTIEQLSDIFAKSGIMILVVNEENISLFKNYYYNNYNWDE